MTSVLESTAIRQADSADLAAVQRLWDASGLSPATPDQWEALLAGETTVVLVAHQADSLIGAAIASFDGWRAYIYHVAVDPAHRRTGIATDLIHQAESYLISAGARSVFVEVHEANTEGLALVASEGYLPDGEIVLTKRLATRVT
jgi:ribosomal protein S18 acetylase RimI-like enzyme